MGGAAALIDFKIVDHRVHGKGQGILQRVFLLEHDLQEPGLRLFLDRGIEDESHAATGHAAQHPEAPETIAEFRTHMLDQALGVIGTCPGDNRFDRTEKVLGGQFTQFADIPLLQGLEDLVEESDRCLTRVPFLLAAQEVFLRNHLQDRAHVLCHAAVHEHEAVLQLVPRLLADFIGPDERMSGQEAPAADTVFGIAFLGGTTGNDLDARPDATGVLPPAAGTAHPFAKDSPGRDDSSVGFHEGTGQLSGLACRPHAGRGQGGEEICRHGEPGTLGDIAYVAHQFKAPSGSEYAFEQALQGMAGTFDAHGDYAGSDHGGLQEAEVVLGEVKQVVQRVDLCHDPQVHAGKADDRLFNDPEKGFHGRLGLRVPSLHCQVDGHVEYSGALGKVHAEKEYITPAGMGEIHADGGLLREYRMDTAGIDEPRVNLESVVIRVTHAEHPLVPAHRLDAAMDLVRQVLQGELVVGPCEG